MRGREGGIVGGQKLRFIDDFQGKKNREEREIIKRGRSVPLILL